MKLRIFPRFIERCALLGFEPPAVMLYWSLPEGDLLVFNDGTLRYIDRVYSSPVELRDAQTAADMARVQEIAGGAVVFRLMEIEMLRPTTLRLDRAYVLALFCSNAMRIGQWQQFVLTDNEAYSGFSLPAFPVRTTEDYHFYYMHSDVEAALLKKNLELLEEQADDAIVQQ